MDDESRDARDGGTRAGGLVNGGAREGNARDSHGRSRVSSKEHAMLENAKQEIAVEAMAYQELAVQLERTLWQQFLPDHDGLLSICKRRQIGMHSGHPENSLDAEDKAARSTPLVR